MLGFVTPDLFGLMPIHGWNIVLHMAAAVVLAYAGVLEPEQPRAARA